ncbi:dihydropteroate synthase [Neptunicella marina]|uniref:Dihydropteroate synthase n=1 Tax=Neptunicella marina TaxID=2125989 RepID=A0A8J6IPW6_9ALTE|nr:dihydropteroate synthase [Neptunicella marina]MBC3764509.1 dihydropteroate synthase [Neptunicella marina]
MQFSNKFVDLSVPRIMGILNVTPDSFSDGGKYNQLDRALYQAEKMLEQGAEFIDVGGESTRPGASDVTLDEELQRVIPVIEAIHKRFDCVVSVDTSKAQVMSESVKAGAGLINDIRALREDGALQAAASANVPVCLMHMQGQPRTMQHNPVYGDVVRDVYLFLAERIEVCVKEGIGKEQILLDPGFGFGKNLQQNYQLLANLSEFHQFGCPLLIGMSRKTMIGKITGKEPDERLAGSLAAATIAFMQGAQIMRVHDVAETIDALRVVQATMECKGKE